MARPVSNMHHNRNQFNVCSKADFVVAVEAMGMTVRQERVKREGWNDTRATFVVKADGTERMVFDQMKGERVDWDECAADAQRFAGEA
mgnify:CR=1 FL=1